jgi:hypothetical protein
VQLEETAALGALVEVMGLGVAVVARRRIRKEIQGPVVAGRKVMF